MLVLKVLFRPEWSWVHRLHFLILSILEYMRLLLRKLMTQQVELKDFFESFTLSCYFSVPNTSSICHNTPACTVLILLLLLLCRCRAREILLNKQQIPSFCVWAKNIIQNGKNRKNWSCFHKSWRSRKGVGTSREILAMLAFKTTGCCFFFTKPQVSNDKLSLHLQNTFNTKGNQRRGKLLSGETTKVTKASLRF